MSCLLSCPISLVSLYGDVSLRSVGLSVSSVKCIAIYCSVTAECWDESIKCQVSHVLSHNMCLVMSHSMCCVNTDVSLLRVKCQVSAECRVECIKCQVSSLLSHNMFLLCHCTGMCLCGVSGWEWWVLSVKCLVPQLLCHCIAVSLYCDVSLRSVGLRVMSVRRNVATHGHTSDC